MFNGEVMAGDVSKPIYSAALHLYYDELGKKIEGMSHYYKITFWNGCNGVEVTKGNSKSICYYGFKVGDTKSATQPSPPLPPPEPSPSLRMLPAAANRFLPMLSPRM